MSSGTAEVAIIGGGVIGCSIAYQLARRGIKSSVFEQHGFASGASGATAGMITPLWHVDHGNPALFALGMNSLKSFPALAAELTEAGIDPELRMCGVLKVAMDDEEAEAIERDLMWQTELGLDVRWVDTQDVLGLEPEINGENHGGVFSPQERATYEANASWTRWCMPQERWTRPFQRASRSSPWSPKAAVSWVFAQTGARCLPTIR